MSAERFDDEYVQRVIASDPEATQHFVRYFGRVVYLKLRHRRLPAALIDDIRQETFLRVVQALRRGQVRDTTKLPAFVNTVCGNVLNEHFRDGGRLSSFELTESEGPSADPDAERNVLSQEQSGRVHATLNRLPSREREILSAVFLEERDKDALCREFNIDRGYLRVLVHRAKNMFRERFRQ